MSEEGVIQVRFKIKKTDKKDEELYEYLEKVPKKNRSYEAERLFRLGYAVRDGLAVDRIVEHP